MKRNTFCGENVSRLGMGNMRLPTLADGSIDYISAEAIIDKLYSAGVNYFDTAYVYHHGESEAFLGKALKKYPRDSFYVATKYNCRANPDYKAVFEEQLSRLDMDRIDFYLLHAVSDGTIDTYLTNGCVEYFLEQKFLGRIRHLGFSFHGSIDTLHKVLAAHTWDFAQIQFNYLDYLEFDARAQYEIITSKNIPIVVMEPVRGGRLASLTPETNMELKSVHRCRSIASWAFRFVMGFDNAKVVLSGMSTIEQAEDNILTFRYDDALSAEERDLLFSVCEMFKKEISAPCTACKYCVDGCPMGINIPEMMTVYNKYKLNGKGALRAFENCEHSAVDCVGCGACSVQCPQNIDIPALMSDMSAAYETLKK